MTKLRVSSFRFLVGLAIVGALTSATAEAATYYVATTGDDSRFCIEAQYIVTPKRTLNNAVQCLNPGETLVIRGGTYSESLTTIPSGTSWSAPVTIRAYSAEAVTLLPGSEASAGIDLSGPRYQYIIIDGLTIDGSATGAARIAGFRAQCGAHHIRVTNTEVRFFKASGVGVWTCSPTEITHDVDLINVVARNNGGDGQGHGIYTSGPNVLIDHATVYGNCGYGIHVFDQLYDGAQVTTDNTTIRNSVVSQNGACFGPADGIAGILLTSGSNLLAYNNVVWGQPIGIQTRWMGATNVKMLNNTVIQNTLWGIDIANPDAEITNNIVVQNVTNIHDEGRGTIFANNLTTDPQFVNPTAFDFHLQSGSPAIDAGASLPEVSTDLEDTPRPQGSAYDIGAYEFTVGGTLRGDLNQDGKRDLADVRLLIYMLLGQEPTTPEADLTGDGAVTLADLQALIRLMVGLP